MENRRNYYRVLHVQPDAPPAVIRATYRTLMQNLKMHPDLGGDTWSAALVNEAYAVLSNPLKREMYDRLILRKLKHRQPQMAQRSQESVDSLPLEAYDRGHCLFCKSSFLIMPGQPTSETCLECRSPMEGIDSRETEIAIRRMAARIEESFEIEYYTYWPQQPRRAVAKNFSPSGIAMVASGQFFIGQLIHIESSLLAAVAQVKNLEAINGSSAPFRIGLKFMTVSFNLPRGTFVEVTV